MMNPVLPNRRHTKVCPDSVPAACYRSTSLFFPTSGDYRKRICTTTAISLLGDGAAQLSLGPLLRTLVRVRAQQATTALPESSLTKQGMKGNDYVTPFPHLRFARPLPRVLSRWVSSTHTWTNVVFAGTRDVLPAMSSPQHAAVPSLRRPQV